MSNLSCRYPVAAPGSASLSNNFKIKSVLNPRWKRAVLKISGATLSGTGPQNVDPKVSHQYTRFLKCNSLNGNDDYFPFSYD